MITIWCPVVETTRPIYQSAVVVAAIDRIVIKTAPPLHLPSVPIDPTLIGVLIKFNPITINRSCPASIKFPSALSIPLFTGPDMNFHFLHVHLSTRGALSYYSQSACGQLALLNLFSGPTTDADFFTALTIGVVFYSILGRDFCQKGAAN
jgi:hypothetical protein